LSFNLTDFGVQNASNTTGKNNLDENFEFTNINFGIVCICQIGQTAVCGNKL